MNNLHNVSWNPDYVYSSTGDYTKSSMKIALNTDFAEKVLWRTIGF